MASTDPVEPISQALRWAIARAIGCDVSDPRTDPVIRASASAQFGDFQANFAMALAKSTGSKPRDLATTVAAAAAAACEPFAEPLEVAGPGFINIRLKSAALASALGAMDSPALGVATTGTGHTVAVDLCGVNVAKQMHVGHLRATIIGDTIARIHERLGWATFRQNHLGDWGLPIAMVLDRVRSQGTNLEALTLDDLNSAYRAAQSAGRGDDAGLTAARAAQSGPHRLAELELQCADANAALESAKRTLVALQSGNADLVRDWRKLIDVTMREVYETAKTLGVHLPPESERGESFFRDKLQPAIQAFVDAKLAQRDQGALVVRFPDRERPLLIQKSDGAALYATTDLAAIRYRIQDLGAERVIYCVDARQRDHFRDAFDAVRMIGWTRLAKPDGSIVDVELVHVPFGSVLGADRKPLKTRSGENFTLKALLDEACARGRREVHARAAEATSPTHGWPTAELDATGDAVGIAAIKYADLSADVTRDYIFDLDRMVAFDGDTGPYLQYAAARIGSIIQRSGLDAAAYAHAPFPAQCPEERTLALALLRHGSAIEQAASEAAPSRLCQHLYALAVAFNGFYQACPVLKAEPESLRLGRLRLCDLTRRTLADGLGLLGITIPARM
ncbi:MAG: arginine--tRNA ligase [Planctomycetota bacterium]|nr:arginine--tRNA ligase [Planctomycetota bacterium]MDA1106363.1 arginine--tRNA ligase [Planctomycetota bacterium]